MLNVGFYAVSPLFVLSGHNKKKTGETGNERVHWGTVSEDDWKLHSCILTRQKTSDEKQFPLLLLELLVSPSLLTLWGNDKWFPSMIKTHCSVEVLDLHRKTTLNPNQNRKTSSFQCNLPKWLLVVFNLSHFNENIIIYFLFTYYLLLISAGAVNVQHFPLRHNVEMNWLYSYCSLKCFHLRC